MRKGKIHLYVNVMKRVGGGGVQEDVKWLCGSVRVSSEFANADYYDESLRPGVCLKCKRSRDKRMLAKARAF